MDRPGSDSLGTTESLGTKLDKLAEALTEGHAAVRSDGVYVDVKADGRVTTVHIDEDAFPGGRQLGPLLTRLLNSAREQAQARVEELVREVREDPRTAAIVEQIGDAPQRDLPPAATRPPGRMDYGHGDEDDEDYHPLRPKSPIAAD
ncbi:MULTISPECIES: YbaB/EbfC family nucleoid-associated protein [unclassified Nocardia]|uniref:YbaB/EbfC family nucleoid-associated protein n=1 Tax=unclassified Nocardia TaxID=2637762 RepID=UPI00278C8530|nr:MULTISPECIES: YbaB/EbfC family nucleoid-associated protein [unclassified Nocardia]